MPSRIGDLEVVNFSSLLVPKDEVATLEFSHDNDFQTFLIRFEEGSSDSKSNSLRMKGGENFLEIVFSNWTNSNGMCTPRPLEVGITDSGRPILILANVRKIGPLYTVDIQTMLGAKNESAQ